MPYVGPAPNPGQNREVDDISSGFNGSEVNFTLQVNSQNVSPGSSNTIIVSLGGVVQNPGTDYTVAASTLTFTTAPASGLSFFGLVLGQGVDTSQPADGSVTSAKIANGAIVNADVNASAAIVGTKISPDFGSQDLVTTGNLDLSDSTGSGNNRIRLGTGDDLHIYFDGTNSFIKEPNSVAGQLIIDGYNGTDIRRGSDGANMIRAIGGGSVELYHNNSLRGYTVSNGFYVDQEQFDDDADVILENKYASLSDNKQSRFIARVDRDAGGSHGGGNRAAVFGHNYNGSTGGGGFFDIRSNDGTNRLFYMDNNTNLRVNFGASNIGTSNGTVVGSQSSDIRNKNLVGDGTVPYGLAEILKLNPIKYQYKKELKDRIGFSAQQVEAIIPESVYDTGEDKDILDNEITGDTIKAMYYVDLIPVLVNGIKELSAKIDTLETKVAALEAA